MSFVVSCNSCGRRFSAPDNAEGKFAKCPACAARIEIRRPQETTDAVRVEPFGATSGTSTVSGIPSICEHLHTLVGQEELVSSIADKIELARKHRQLFPHLLLSGPAECGKTTLVACICRSLGVGLQIAKAADLKSKTDVLPYFTNAEEGSILLIEDIESLSAENVTFLLPAIQENRVDITLGEGAGARTVNMKLRPFTLVLSTSKPSRIDRRLARWCVGYDFKPYSKDELCQIVMRMAARTNLNLPWESVSLIVSCCGQHLGEAEAIIKRIPTYPGYQKQCLSPNHITTILGWLGYDKGRMNSLTLSATLCSMTGLEFERFVAGVFQSKGYHIEFTNVTGDHGIDLLMRKNNLKTAVQCKRWKESVGEPTIRDFLGSMIHCGAESGIVVTTAYFTSQAIAFAEDKQIRLIDLDALIQINQGFD